ncbi:hypothetical protein AGOR_G00050040 [Albula goreensis]|uniref:C-C motif chemokine n=1 Tax=Albula goreensis TaxID=1534307 RepID=A0A8T3E0Q1_9TELE|nr:hypothetical protein AGOR_G00050040 [Albula goreensis]
MAPTASLFFLGLFWLHYCSSPSQGELALDCCLKVSKHPIPKRIVNDYKVQVKGQGCDIEAIVFITKKDKRLCAPHGSVWVQELISAVIERKKWCKKNNFKHKGCRGIKQ